MPAGGGAAAGRSRTSLRQDLHKFLADLKGLEREALRSRAGADSARASTNGGDAASGSGRDGPLAARSSKKASTRSGCCLNSSPPNSSLPPFPPLPLAQRLIKDARASAGAGSTSGAAPASGSWLDLHSQDDDSDGANEAPSAEGEKDKVCGLRPSLGDIRCAAMIPTGTTAPVALAVHQEYEEVEADCTEALLLDDCYLKAYQRRGTARLELKKLLLAVEDFEVALRLEPENKELQKQYLEAKEHHMQVDGVRAQVEKLRPPQATHHLAVRGLRSPAKEGSHTQGSATSETKLQLASTSDALRGDLQDPATFTSRPEEGSALHTGVHEDRGSRVQTLETEHLLTGPGSHAGRSTVPATSSARVPESAAKAAEHATAAAGDVPRDGSGQARMPTRPGRQQPFSKTYQATTAMMSVAERAVAKLHESVKGNLAPPRTAYEFEVRWKGLHGDRIAQAKLLHTVEAASLPSLFKDALSAPLLVDIIKVLAACFIPSEAEYTADVLESIARAKRFNMTVMCLTHDDKQGLQHVWDVWEGSPMVPDHVQTQLRAVRVLYRV
eukprot:SM000088S23747  [mRNA]  locus=s88:577657:580624:+ [translate_table: standard]